jgi:hypothetical protein
MAFLSGARYPSLPVGTVNCVQTLKANAEDLFDEGPPPTAAAAAIAVMAALKPRILPFEELCMSMSDDLTRVRLVSLSARADLQNNLSLTQAHTPVAQHEVQQEITLAADGSVKSSLLVLPVPNEGLGVTVLARPRPKRGNAARCSLGFDQKFALEDVIGSHSCSHKANKRVINIMPLWSPPSYRLTL